MYLPKPREPIPTNCWPLGGQQEPTGNGEEDTVPSASSGESKQKMAAARPGRGRSALDRQLRKAMDANLQELELMHKRVSKRRASGCALSMRAGQSEIPPFGLSCDRQKYDAVLATLGCGKIVQLMSKSCFESPRRVRLERSLFIRDLDVKTNRKRSSRPS